MITGRLCTVRQANEPRSTSSVSRWASVTTPLGDPNTGFDSGVLTTWLVGAPPGRLLRTRVAKNLTVSTAAWSGSSHVIGFRDGEFDEQPIRPSQY